jgi:hypothetical protein
VADARVALELLHVLLVPGAVLELTVEGADARPAGRALLDALARHTSSAFPIDVDGHRAP